MDALVKTATEEDVLDLRNSITLKQSRKITIKLRVVPILRSKVILFFSGSNLSPWTKVAPV